MILVLRLFTSGFESVNTWVSSTRSYRSTIIRLLLREAKRRLNHLKLRFLSHIILSVGFLNSRILLLKISFLWTLSLISLSCVFRCSGCEQNSWAIGLHWRRAEAHRRLSWGTVAVICEMRRVKGSIIWLFSFLFSLISQLKMIFVGVKWAVDVLIWVLKFNCWQTSAFG